MMNIWLVSEWVVDSFGPSKAVADLRGRGVQILSISCSFWENLAKLYVGPLPPASWRSLLGEFMDTPLKGTVTIDRMLNVDDDCDGDRPELYLCFLYLFLCCLDQGRVGNSPFLVMPFRSPASRAVCCSPKRVQRDTVRSTTFSPGTTDSFYEQLENSLLLE